MFIRKHRVIPITRGVRIDATVHKELLVSFFIDIQVVEHGKWNKQNTQTHIAVIKVQLLAIRTVLSSAKDEKSERILLF